MSPDQRGKLRLHAITSSLAVSYGAVSRTSLGQTLEWQTLPTLSALSVGAPPGPARAAAEPMRPPPVADEVPAARAQSPSARRLAALSVEGRILAALRDSFAPPTQSPRTALFGARRFALPPLRASLPTTHATCGSGEQRAMAVALVAARGHRVLPQPAPGALVRRPAHGNQRKERFSPGTFVRRRGTAGCANPYSHPLASRSSCHMPVPMLTPARPHATCLITGPCPCLCSCLCPCL